MGSDGSQALLTILALAVARVLQVCNFCLTNSRRSKDSESTWRTDDGSGEEKEVLRRDLASTSRTDHVSGEEYDVFLSFQGPDTRNGFTNCLYHRLRDAGIRVFLDNEELRIGKEMGGELLEAHDRSRIYIPIFSKGYADSPWCLREIAHMVRCTSTSDGKKEVLPIFYDVNSDDPIFYDVNSDDVKLKTKLHRKAMCKHMTKFGSDEVKRWENALLEVARIKGWDLKGKRQGEQIEAIVEEISRKLNTRHVIVTEHLVEDIAQMEAIMKLLDVGSGGVRYVGIHGMGGAGKTTLAKVMFNKLSFHFERCSFLQDVRALSQSHGGLIELQKKLLSDLVGHGIANQIKDVDGGIKMIKKALSAKKVLIVLDDLDKKEQLEKLAGKSDWFCSGSRIIITTRDESILMTQVGSSSEKVLNIPKGIMRYEVHEMRFDLALDLFYKHAFRSDFVAEEFDALSREIVCTVGMLPLAVVVIGSNLFDWGIDLGHLEKIEVWNETLKKLKEGPFEDVRDTLMISYEQLEDKHQEVFLDIACFFINADRTYPVMMWKDCGYLPSIAMRVLSQRSLIKITDDNRFWMHDQVRDFGRNIVLRVYPRKFCRVWIRDDALKLLEGKKRSENVEALSLASDGCSCGIASKVLAALPNLRFLQVKGVDFFGNFENLLSELRWFSWEVTHKEFYAESFHFASLVVLDLSKSDIEDDWGGWSQIQMTKKLKVLDLTDCTKLRRTPNFSNFTSLETLVLVRCSNLATIHPSISKLQLLETLNIKGCSSLGELPEEVCSLQSLKEIVMPQNFQPLKLPERFGNLKSLTSFTLNKNPKICQLPDSIGGAANLTRLTLRGCVGIKELPSSIGELHMLVELDVTNSGIIELPDSVGNLKKLRVLSLCRTKIKEIPRTIGGLEMLEGLYAHKSWDLTDKNLEELGKLFHLKTLDLSFTSVCRLPREISRLHLQKLKVGSIDLQQVPALPSSLKFFAVQAMNFSLVPQPSSITNLEHLELERFSNLRHRHHSTRRDYDTKLKVALMREQPSYQLPSLLSVLKLKSINPLPHFTNLINLTVLHVIECPISHLPVAAGLIHLRELNITRCESLEEIPGMSLLRSLERLELKGLTRLAEIQGLGEMESLRYLLLSSCGIIRQLPNLSKLGKLQHLELEACPNLRAIEGIEGLESWALDSRGHTILERFLNISRSTWLSHSLPMYDLFLSYKGPDTHHSIVDYIHNRMWFEGIPVYSDNDDFSSNEGIGEEILQAFANSNIYMPVFSRNYASSHWCLRKLGHMVKCTSESKGKKIILPIFYDVEIDDVKIETGLYKSDLDRHRTNFNHNEVRSWEEALIEVAAMRGFILKNTSYEEVLQVVFAEIFRARKLLDLDS